MASRACSFLKGVAGKVPPSVIFAIVNSFFNGWATEARFQVKSGRCVICSSCTGDDSIEHYSSCSYAWRAFARRYRRPVFPMCMARFFGLYASNEEDYLRYACNIFAVRNLVIDSKFVSAPRERMM